MIGGRYRMGRAIGRGGMGEVYLAEDTVLGREVAVKRIAKTDEDQATATERLLREARSAARIHHPHVVTVHDLVVEGNAAYIIMEYVPAENLAQILRRGPIGPERAAGIGAQVADALNAAHALGVVHRDVKPSNILVAPGDLVKLTDFGVARVAGDTGLTRTGHMIGSIAYMPPEIARGTEATPAADLYSLGATLYAAVEGRAPFATEKKESSTSVAMLVRLVTETAPQATHAGPLTGLIADLLSPEPSTRPTASLAAAALRRLAASEATDESPGPIPAPEPDAPEPQPEDESQIETRIRPAGLRDPVEDRTVRREAAHVLPPTAAVAAKPATPPVQKSATPPVRKPATAGAINPPPGQPPADVNRPLTPIQKQDRRRRRAMAVIIVISLAGIASAVAINVAQMPGTRAAGDVTSGIAARVGNSVIAESTVQGISSALADESADASDTGSDFSTTVLNVLVKIEVGSQVMADQRTSISAAKIDKMIAENSVLSSLAKNPLTEQFVNDYATLSLAADDEQFKTAFKTQLKSVSIWVNPGYGSWDRESGEVVGLSTSPSPSSSPI
jgi:serine/threonine protein kinase